MRLRKLTVRHFRNIGFAALELKGSRHFFVGANGQGKTNLLEAAGFITALRSFRTADQRLLIGTAQPCAAVSCDLEHERRGETHIQINIHREHKELLCDNVRVPRLADHLGQFPTVIFSSQDIQLIRGSPAGRRRWLDLTLSAMDATYFRALQAYLKALESRNSLLKRDNSGPTELEGFESQLATCGSEIIRARRAGLGTLSGKLNTAYAAISESAEPAALEYLPSFDDETADALAARLESGRERDRIMGATQVGPHRDDFRFKVKGAPAEDYGSEGQQRSSVLALRLAEASWFQERSGIRPVLLADDVLGELDPARRMRFWHAIDPEAQILATGTSAPDASLGNWQLFTVTSGAFDSPQSEPNQ